MIHWYGIYVGRLPMGGRGRTAIFFILQTLDTVSDGRVNRILLAWITGSVPFSLCNFVLEIKGTRDGVQKGRGYLNCLMSVNADSSGISFVPKIFYFRMTSDSI